jgi:Ca2+-binding RTX toxin-like protein
MVASKDDIAVLYLGSGQQIHVHGSVVGGAAGIVAQGGTNSLIVIGETGRVTGMSQGISFDGGGHTIRNAGVIEGLGGGPAVRFFDGLTSNALVNSGSIRSTADAIEVSNGTQAISITNTGRIEAGADWRAFDSNATSTASIVNRGTMVGDVLLGLGHDLLDSRSGTISGTVSGGDGNDRLWTGSGANTLFGGAGYDDLRGGAGADRLDGGTEVDTASYASAVAGVKASLAAPGTNSGDAKGDVYVSIERLYGSSFADTLVGNGGMNQLTGAGGADVLTGGGGADRFVFVTAAAGSGTADRITDFVTDLDEIRLENAVFAALGAAGDLAPGAFKANSSGLATDSSDRVIYETDTGWLRYDANGNAAGGGTIFGRVAAGLALGADDFVVI